MAPGPVIMTAVHLCGVLSLNAVRMFNDNPSMSMLTLKPCCLPPMSYITRNAPKSGLPITEWTIGKPTHGSPHIIPAKEVCAAGKFVKKVWHGPPRSHIRAKFERWAAHLLAAVDIEAEVVGGAQASADTTTSGGQAAGRSRTKGTQRRSAKALETICVQADHWQNLFVFAYRRGSRGHPVDTGVAGAACANELLVAQLRQRLSRLQAKNAALRLQQQSQHQRGGAGTTRALR